MSRQMSNKTNSTGWMITIDGGAATGKSSVAAGIAQNLGVPYLSSGLLYRAVAWLVRENTTNLPSGQPSDQPSTADMMALLSSGTLHIDTQAGQNVLYWQNQPLGDLHSSDIDQRVSAVASIPQVRAWVNAQLLSFPKPFVAEGRDMGSTVFPDANYKFFLSASPRVRAQRRSLERPEDIDALEQLLISRDLLDAQQLQAAPDACRIDTDHMTLAEVIQHILDYCQSQQEA